MDVYLPSFKDETAQRQGPYRMLVAEETRTAPLEPVDCEAVG